MEHPADAMATEIADHRHAMAFGIFLDGGGDIAKRIARLDLRQAERHGFVGHIDQTFGLRRHNAYLIHA